ncbi:Resolvase, N-terminal domain [Alkaliphilus metalliredigens QYMF]|uniref:Resolvase, N-terminal domain n=1 Tax=Alkaliphilus metalliredigens (strain QYMF) TaxID=293826 RepID=A6TMS3_ALKMQ|nr:recombinase family protein [Alkaliphilus metalliredigens]ABR47491.1 Resolvase, N-terminal domain [Alkaliphilus metalliredigens QYMF]
MCTVAIYSRKSKFTGKGESIQNQIELCQEYAEKHFSSSDFSIYEDEGYSGGDVDRPMFKSLMKDIKNRKIKLLICYRLDRVSRNISDFSRLMELLEKYNVDFVSIREQFDTSTPMGRAMMYITSVFSHLERETIAERIKDNMYQLARTGRWLGGNTPMGYTSHPLAYYDHNGSEKKMYALSPIPDELKIVRELYHKYLGLSSLTQLESWTLENNIKTKNGKDFDKSILKIILTNPVYTIADKLIYRYFKDQGADITHSPDEFNDRHGLMVFNKYNEKNNRILKKDVSEWIIAVGRHPGVISSQDWIRTQELLQYNSKKAPRSATGKVGLLAEVLRCGHCGSRMRVIVYRRKSGTYHYYRCLLKERSKGSKCCVENLNGKRADQYVIDKIKNIGYEKHEFYHHLRQLKGNINDFTSFNHFKEVDLKKELKQSQKSIYNLTLKLSTTTDDTVTKYIIQQIKELDLKITENQFKIQKVKDDEVAVSKKQTDIDSLLNLINNFSAHTDQLSFLEKKKLLKQVVDHITWDGGQLEIVLLDKNALTY